VRLIGAPRTIPSSLSTPAGLALADLRAAALSEEELYALLQRALGDVDRGLGYLKVQADENRAAAPGEAVRWGRAQGVERAGDRRADDGARRGGGDPAGPGGGGAKASRRRRWCMTTRTRTTTRSQRSSVHAGERPGRGIVLAGQDDPRGEDPRFIARRLSFTRRRTWGWRTRWRWCWRTRRFRRRSSSAGRRRGFRWRRRRSTLRRRPRATARSWS